MTRLHAFRPALVIGVPMVLAVASTLSSYSRGVQPGTAGVPSNAARTLPSCSNCHLNAHGGGPRVSLTPSKYALLPGESITATTTATGGVPGTTGGFLTETTGGAFVPMGNTHLITNSKSITHSDNTSRTWTYGFTAPVTPGLVEMFGASNTVNGDGTNFGDKFAFAGFDPNATSATPVRLFVLPQGVTNAGPGCPDGFGNRSVLGASGVPTVGNLNFGAELHGAAPGSLGFLLAGFNPPGFTSIDLGAAFGLTGCNGYVASPIATLSSATTAGIPERAEGTATFALPIPNIPLQGLVLDVQGAYIDPSAVTMLGRSAPASFSNGLKITVQ